VTDEGFKLSPEREVTLSGRKIAYEKWIYLMLNKPPGVVSASEGEKRETVIGLLDAKYRGKGLFPVGRLDKDTSGLLLITNDGAFAHNTLSPARHVEKTYEAEVDGFVGEADAEAFAAGVVLENGERCLPARLEILRAPAAESSTPSMGGLPGPRIHCENSQVDAERFFTAKVRITLCEGKYHQVKRMFAAVGKRVLSLKRVSFGEIALDGELEEGRARELNDKEKKWVRDNGGH